MFQRVGRITTSALRKVRQQEQPSGDPNANASTTRPKSNPIPDSFTNLQVIPTNIPKKDLVNVMKQFSTTFSVRCSFCHAVSDDLTEGNFASDEKPTKLKARELLKTIQSLQVKTANEVTK